MATLTGQKVKDTYKSLVKVNDNGELAATLQELTDGNGNGSGVSLNTAGDLKAEGTIEFGSLKDTAEDITISKFVDEADGITNNNNDTTIPTTAAIIDYVAAQITLEDLDFQGDTGTGSVDLDSQSLKLSGANGISTTATAQTITIDASSLNTRLTTAEADIDTNTSNITAEETARIAADTTLQNNINAEASARSSADTTLQTNINNEAATRLANDNTLQSNIDAETSARTTADSTLQTNIDSEAATRLANDNTLQSNIDAEASTRGLADTTLQTNIDNEETARIAADLALQTQITSNDTDITALQAADVTLQSNIDSEASTRASADTALQGQIDSNDTDIATNAANIATNVTNIATNAANISSNDTDILGLDTRLTTAEGNIASNDTDISTLQSDKYDKTGGTISGSVTITNDLTVNGTTTTVNTETLSVKDPLIEMANDNTANTVDTGFYANYSLDAGVTSKYAGLFKDASDSDKFKLFKGLEVEPVTTVNVLGAGYAKGDLVIGDLNADSGSISGTLSATTLGGTLSTAAQPNITSVGTLSTLTVASTVKVNNGAIYLEDSNKQVAVDPSDNILLWQRGASGIRLLTNDLERMRIDSSGNVGIGTSSPSNKLEISSDGGDSFKSSSTITTSFNRSTLYNDNSKGIQTIVYGSAYSVGTLLSVGADGTAIYGNSKTAITTLGAFDLLLGTNGTERMRIDSSGRVGIGTLNPVEALQIEKAIDANTAIRIVNTNTGNAANARMYLESDSARIDIAAYSSTYSSVGAWQEAGVVTTGNASSNGLFLNAQAGGIKFMTNITERLKIHNGGDISFRDTSANEAFYWDASAASLGIGTGSSPSATLHISDAVTLAASTEHLLIQNTTTGQPAALAFTAVADNGGAGNEGAIYFDAGADGTAADNIIAFNANHQTGNNYDMVIKGDGNVGIGTTSPDSTGYVNLETAKNIRINVGGVAADPVLYFSHDNFLSATSNYITVNRADESMRFNVNDSERMRITSGGNVLIGTTGTPNGTSNYGSAFITGGNSKKMLYLATSVSTADELVRFFNSNGQVGNISVGGSSTTYATSSDYRLKENVVEMTGALDRVDALKPSRFNFIADPDKTVDGFLAHEVADVVPEAITGEKDAVDDEGNAVYQGIDQSKLVPLLVGAIQELKAEIELLKQQLNK